jgi:hypothetical protein
MVHVPRRVLEEIKIIPAVPGKFESGTSDAFLAAITRVMQQPLEKKLSPTQFAIEMK